MRKETIKKLIDFEQSTEILEMDIKINEVCIKIPDRICSKNFLSLKVKEFKVS
jgi:hypothetical protein